MVLMNLSKLYDCLPQDRLITKLEAYGFGIDSLKFTERKQWVKRGTSFSSWKTLSKGVAQGGLYLTPFDLTYL